VPPALVALLLQFAAFVGVLAITVVFKVKPAGIVFACCCGLVAAGLSYVAKQDRWWWVIQLLFAPALLAALTLKIPPVFYLAGFFTLLLLFWNVVYTQVPLYLSSRKVWLALGQFLPPPNPGGFDFLDMGSGLGGVLTYLARIRPDGRYFGVESAPLPCAWSWVRIRLGGYRRCQVQCRDFWSCDLSRYDVVFAYLSPAPMERLWLKAKAEMKPGAVFISSTFSVPGQTPHQAIVVDDLHQSTVQVWRM